MLHLHFFKSHHQSNSNLLESHQILKLQYIKFWGYLKSKVTLHQVGQKEYIPRSNPITLCQVRLNEAFLRLDPSIFDVTSKSLQVVDPIPNSTIPRYHLIQSAQNTPSEQTFQVRLGWLPRQADRKSQEMASAKLQWTFVKRSNSWRRFLSAPWTEYRIAPRSWWQFIKRHSAWMLTPAASSESMTIGTYVVWFQPCLPLSAPATLWSALGK